MFGIKNKATGKITETRSTASYKASEIPDGYEAITKKGIMAGDKLVGDKLTKEVITPVVDKILEDVKALDPNNPGADALKTIIEYLQK